MALYEGMLAETVGLHGHNGEYINAYFARPLGAGSYPGVVVIHHMPGWDEGSKEIVRKFAYHGYAAISPNLFYREAPDASSDDAAAAVRAAGGVPDERCVGDVDAAAKYLRALPYSNGKVGIIGYCSGGRQVYLVACKLKDIDAAVDCYGGRVVATQQDLSPRAPVAPIDMTKDMSAPLLGLFGKEDGNPNPEHVAKMEEELKRHGKTYEFHSYDNTGHGFFSVDRPAYRPESAADGWNKIFAWYGKYLSSEVPATETASRR